MFKMVQLLLLTTLFIGTAFGQNEKAEIQQFMESYIQLVEQNEYVKLLDCVHPKLFDFVPKEAMVEALEKRMSDSNTKVSIHNCQMGTISDITELEGVKYAVANYSAEMQVYMSFEEDSSSTIHTTELTFDMLKINYGAENVSFDEEKKCFNMQLNNQLFAIKNPACDDWKVLEKKDSLKPIAELLLPEEIIEAW